MADNPSHYHAIDRITARWRDYMTAIEKVATNPPGERERANREEQRREVHETGVKHSQKGG